MKLRLLQIALAASMLTLSPALAIDPSLPPYEKADGISGQIKSVGSDTLINEMNRWSKSFLALYPDVKITVEGQGSATAPPALIAGTAQFGPMSRAMTTEESAEFEKKYGYKVSQFRVAVDSLAVYVNKDNPINCLSLQQLNRIFSSTRRVAFGGNIGTWGDVGLTGDWANRPIALYGRNEMSGTYSFFREMALNDGQYKLELKMQPNSEAVVQMVANDRYAIGYSGIGYKTSGVRTVPLAVAEGTTCSDTTAEAAYSHKYPLARYLYIYVNKKPDAQLEPLRRELIKYILSKDGQMETEAGGFYSITNADRESDLKRLGIIPVSQ
jgi:phosphate transport system substrate-binding protein